MRAFIPARVIVAIDPSSMSFKVSDQNPSIAEGVGKVEAGRRAEFVSRGPGPSAASSSADARK